MRQKLRNRIGMSLHFSLVVFFNFVFTSMLIAAISFIALKVQPVDRFDSRNIFFMIVIVLAASVIVGTVLSPVIGRRALKPFRKVISATDKLAGGDFSVRLDISHPPEFNKLAKSFNRMAEDLGGIELLRTDFINNFSHEFKTPIVSIKGFAEILKYDDLTSEERNEYLDIVISESSRLAALATNVLNLSKVENQQILTDKLTFDLGEQIRRCILILEPKWNNKNISLSVNLQDLQCFGNEEFLSQVWINLLDNALKFTPEGGKITVALGTDNEKAKFVLRDNGAGISEDAATHIFDKFYQADTSHAAEGNGLGLTLAKKIVELHGGSIACKSRLDEGTEFTVLLPLK
ncbi:MAG: HAMP domain-containing histidine kinase [Oscillospiraceae bacterium]|nr:HAMP domain-containing histidine kinase [Oscillospiraceae bacterium]